MSLLQKVKNTFSQSANGSNGNGIFIFEEKFSLLLNSIPSIVTYVDKNHYLLYVNAAFETLFGIDTASVVGKPLADFLGKKGYASIKEYMETALSGTPVHYEMEVPLKSGKRFIDAIYTPDFDENGNVRGYIGLINDVSEKKKTEKELKRKQLELQDYVDNATVGLHWVDANGIILWANKAELNMLGYSEEEYIGHHIAEFHVSKEKIDNILTRLSSNEALYQHEAELRHKNGSVRTVLINSNVLWEDGEFIHTRCFTTDIHDRKQIEKALQDSEIRYRGLVQSLPAALYTCDAEGRITMYNNAAVELWGREPEPGKDFWCGSWKIYEPDGLTPIPLDKCPMARTLKEGREVKGEEIIVERPDGLKYNIRPYPKPLFDSTGQLTGAVNMLMNITPEKKAEQLIRESEERMRMAIQSTKLGTWEFLPLTGALNWSDECRKIYDAPADLKVDYQFFSDHIHPEDADFAKQTIQKAMEPDNDGNYDIQYRILRYSDKQPRWIRAQGKVYFTANKQPERFIGTVLDITEEKTQEQELKDSIELFATMADNVPVMIWMSGDDKFCDFFNKTWLEFTGRTLEQESNEGWLENVHPDDVQKCIDNYNKSFNAQTGFYTEYRLKRHDGQYRWIADNSVPRYNADGAFSGFISACMDIDEQKRFREKIQESELLFKTISNASPAALWMTDKDEKNVFVSNTWLEWTGKTFEEQINRGWLLTVLPEDKEVTISKFHQCFAERKNFSAEFRFKRKDGEIRWGLTEGRPYNDINGVFAGYAGSVTDITEIKKLEERKDDFIKMASHELKTPITSIKGYVQLLLNIYDELNAEKFQATKTTVKSSLNTISKQVSKLTRLVSELLDLSRIESGKLELNKTDFDLGDLVEETVQDVRHTTSNHAIIIHNNFEGNIYGDKDRIAQVILNLLTNAIKYSPDADNVEVFVEGDKNMAIIKVRDHGIGIDKKDHQNIFERFYRVEGKSEQTYPGFGIGLFIASEIIYRHHGTISVESEKGKGSVFTITLPAGFRDS